MTLDELRRMAVGHSLFPPTTLRRALHHMKFVQADPIRAPARAQDLILRQRVKGYRAGDLERRYAGHGPGALGVEEDFFINYGFVRRELQVLMHPRAECRVPIGSSLPWPGGRRRRAQQLLEFVRERGVVHPQEVDKYFAHGKVKNYWGGNSNATTHLLDALHYQGLLRVVRRDAGIRVYALHNHAPAPTERAALHARLDALADAAIELYAPLPQRSLRALLRRLRFAAPQWEREIPGVIARAGERLAHENIGGFEWYWPAEWTGERSGPDDSVRLLAPFDPVVWDRHRFERLWGWEYRFEAYTPVAKRVRGYYALPALWRDEVIGWANLSVLHGGLKADVGYVGSAPRDHVFRRELEAEVERMRIFLGVD
ncbi:MAG: crosslink repair DNA glycosylase YcaQ family protein [Candidatus Sulfotelmatobacter sp.]